MTNAIETKSLVKTFGSTLALAGVDLAIRKGSVFGLLGPNGAGKTTIIRILTTLLKPTSGRALVLGHDVVREAHMVRQKISLTGQYASVDEDLTGHENLVLVSRLLGLSWKAARARATELLSALAAIVTLAWRSMLKIKHVPFQLFDVTITPIMFTLLFTFMFGGALAGSPETYIQFLLPGILVQTILFITVYTGVGVNSDIQKGLFDRFRSLPMWQPAPIVGALAGDLFRYSVAAMLIIGIGLILGFRPNGGPIGVLLAFGLVLIFAFAVSWIWIIIGMKVKTPESVMTTSFLVLMPLTFASNIFVGLETMPSWLQAIVGHNPVTHLANASRGLMHGQDVGFDIMWVLIASATIVLVAAPVALRMYYQER